MHCELGYFHIPVLDVQGTLPTRQPLVTSASHSISPHLSRAHSQSHFQFVFFFFSPDLADGKEKKCKAKTPLSPFILSTHALPLGAGKQPSTNMVCIEMESYQKQVGKQAELPSATALEGCEVLSAFLANYGTFGFIHWHILPGPYCNTTQSNKIKATLSWN